MVPVRRKRCETPAMYIIVKLSLAEWVGPQTECQYILYMTLERSLPIVLASVLNLGIILTFLSLKKYM